MQVGVSGSEPEREMTFTQECGIENSLKLMLFERLDYANCDY